MNKYSSILNMERPISKHKKMSLYDRAAQFMPFSALTGYDDLICEKGRFTSNKIILNDEQKSNINNILRNLKSDIKNKPVVKIEYFIKDLNKNGGKYITKIVKLNKIDEFNNKIITSDKEIIYFDNIINISYNM